VGRFCPPSPVRPGFELVALGALGCVTWRCDSGQCLNVEDAAAPVESCADARR